MTKLAARITTLALATLPFAGACDNALTKPSLYNTVRVAVTQRNGVGVPGAHLTLYTGIRPMGYGATDSRGEFSFTRVPQGVYGVLLDPPAGYERLETLLSVPPSTVVDELKVQGDSLPPLRFTLLRRGPGVIVARIVQTNGSPISGAAVTLYDPFAVRGTVRTDATGRAVFNAVPFGLYGVSVERPHPFRDFQALGDSTFAFRDDLIAEEGVRDSVAIVLAKCAGSIRLSAVDQTGAPVAGSTAIVYTATQALIAAQTTADGRATLADVPCVTQVGVSVAAPAGYSIAPGRGSSFMDGITLRSGQVLDLSFRLVKL